jgi:hypothetical protein
MIVKSYKNNLEYPLMGSKKVIQDSLLSLEKDSDDYLVLMIIKSLPLERQKLAGKQIKIYLKKINAHPRMKAFYVLKIKELISYERKLIKKGKNNE